MTTWKERWIVKIPVYLLTILLLATAVGSGTILLVGYDNGTFFSPHYVSSQLCRNSMNSQLWSYERRLDNASDWATVEVLEDGRELDAAAQAEIDTLTQEFRTELLSEIEVETSVENSNFQVLIIDNTTGQAVLNTFTDDDYYEARQTQSEDYTLYGALRTQWTVQDSYAGEAVMHYQMWGLYPDIWWYFGISLTLSLVGLALIIAMAGHKKGKDGISLGWVDRIPTDIWFLVAGLTGGWALYLAGTAGWDGWNQQSDPAFVVAMIAVAVIGLLYFVCISIKTIETVAVRIKSNTFFRNTLVWIFCHGVGFLLRQAPAVWRTAVLGLGICAVNGILGMMSMMGFFPWLLFALYNVLLIVGLCLLSWQQKLLQQGAQRLAEGHLTDKIDTRNLYFDFKTHGDTLNTIGDGIGLAVDEKLKSQRMKTELITNVSHDIKTPLTSIVTTVELLQKDHDEAQHATYLAVLQRQSMGLKKLVEDLVEASKASTGNLPCTLQPTDLVEAIDQALAEYEGKLQAASLTLVTQLPDSCTVHADGRLLWRVLDNLLGNACKYAMPGTRLYVSLAQDKVTTLSIKNISNEPLNLTADELTERFVRGETSRTTDGSGLGLNIAQSLMQLQGGQLHLFVDGDFFKAELRF